MVIDPSARPVQIENTCVHSNGTMEAVHRFYFDKHTNKYESISRHTYRRTNTKL